MTNRTINQNADAALAHLSNALDDLESSPDQRPVPLIREAMEHLREIMTTAERAAGGVDVGDAMVERMAVNRYRPIPSGVIGYAVVAGDGTRKLFCGTKDECYVVARKLTEAFLDGAYAALTAALSPRADADSAGGA